MKKFLKGALTALVLVAAATAAKAQTAYDAIATAYVTTTCSSGEPSEEFRIAVTVDHT